MSAGRSACGSAAAQGVRPQPARAARGRGSRDWRRWMLGAGVMKFMAEWSYPLGRKAASIPWASTSFAKYTGEAESAKRHLWHDPVSRSSV